MVALPTTRVAVMGPAGVEFVYKKELKAIRGSIDNKIDSLIQDLISHGVSQDLAQQEAKASVEAWRVAEEAELALRYERELMNPNEALSLGSISQIVMPQEVRSVLADNLAFHLRHYQPTPLSGPQREFH